MSGGSCDSSATLAFLARGPARYFGGDAAMATLVAVLIAVPVIAVLSNVFATGQGTWQHLAETVLGDYVRTTVLLLTDGLDREDTALLAREAARLGLPPVVRPDSFPQNSLAATRVAVHGAEEPWIGAYVRAVYAAEFARGDE